MSKNSKFAMHIDIIMGLDATKPVFGDYMKTENLNFACSKSRYDTFQTSNNRGADKTARVICAFVVRKPPNTGFLASRPNIRY